MMRRILLSGAVAALLATAPAAAQQPTVPRQPTPAAADTSRRPAAAPRDTSARDTTAADTTARRRVSPGVAFYRSLLIPGWGQISTGAYRRAAVFITLQGASDFMLIKTLNKLKQAENREKTLRPQAFKAWVDSLNALKTPADSAKAKSYLDSPTAQTALLDTLAAAGHGLVVSRKKQREDWITLAVFWTLASAADALVLAELSDFPAEVGVEPRAGGGMFLRVALPVRKPW